MLWARDTATQAPSWRCFRAADPLKISIDPNGNLNTKTEGTDNWTYSWNAENELTRVTKNGAEEARFSYDPKGRRVEKAAGGVTTSYTYDGIDILRETRGAAALKYVHGLDIDAPLAVDDTGASSYFHADALGSIAKRTSQVGVVLHEYRYDAWGNIEAGAGEPGYAFTGREWDVETGLYYYRARYYDARSGRFLGEDPLRPPKHMWADPSLYPYVGENPTSRIDPSGMASVDCAKKLAELAAAIAALQLRLYENAGRADKGHDKAIRERIAQIRKLAEQVARHCRDAGRKAAAAAAAAASAATECFVTIVPDICMVVPEACCKGRYVGPGGCAGAGETF